MTCQRPSSTHTPAPAPRRERPLFPGIVLTARADRAFLCRAVRHLAGEVGIRQFLDIGTGLPTMDNTHEVAGRP